MFNDGDGNGNVKKALSLTSKTTTLHVHHAFFVHFPAVPAQLRREMAKFYVHFRTERQGYKFYHLCLRPGAVPSLQLQHKFPSFKYLGDLG